MSLQSVGSIAPTVITNCAVRDAIILFATGMCYYTLFSMYDARWTFFFPGIFFYFYDFCRFIAARAYTWPDYDDVMLSLQGEGPERGESCIGGDKLPKLSANDLLSILGCGLICQAPLPSSVLTCKPALVLTYYGRICQISPTQKPPVQKGIERSWNVIGTGFFFDDFIGLNELFGSTTDHCYESSPTREIIYLS